MVYTAKLGSHKNLNPWKSPLPKRLSFVGFDLLITGSGLFFPCRKMYKVLQGAGVRVEEVLVHPSPTERKLLWDINPWEEAKTVRWALATARAAPLYFLVSPS